VITASCEEPIDYEETARVATEAFGSLDIVFYPKQFQWFYERCFSLGTTVVTLRDGNRKIGQCAMVRQLVLVNGVYEPAAQLVDLFVTEEFRSKDCLRQLYGEVEHQCIAQKIRFALGMPNARALAVNAHFFKMRPFLWLPMRMGLAVPFRSSTLIFSGLFQLMKKEEAVGLFARYRTPSDENGLQWDEERLYQRLCGPSFSYGVHATKELLLISSPRSSRGVKYALLCGFFVRPGAPVPRGNAGALVRASCHLWKRPLFVYVGFNNALADIPGFPLPQWFRPSPMHLQLRDFQPERPAPNFDRYQPLDFEFA
jgi:Acetyltransferase (GNAT) domain